MKQRLHGACRTIERTSNLGDVHVGVVTQGERVTLPFGQPLQELDDFVDLRIDDRRWRGEDEAALHPDSSMVVPRRVDHHSSQIGGWIERQRTEGEPNEYVVYEILCSASVAGHHQCQSDERSPVC